MDIWIPFLGNYTFEQSVGLLPYPVTFLVTDIISEVYGQKRANKVVTSGLFASLFMLIVVTISDMFKLLYGLQLIIKHLAGYLVYLVLLFLHQ